MNPAEQSALDEAERAGTIVGSDVDRIESDLLAELGGGRADGRDVHYARCHSLDCPCYIDGQRAMR